MNRLILLVVLSVSSVAFSQKNISYHIVSLDNKKDVALDYNFYVENVYDGRQFKENIGTVQKGAFNKKVLANFGKSLEVELLDYLSVICPNQEGKHKISIRIIDVYVSELTRAMSETGYATLVLDVIKEKDGVNYVVGTFSAFTESNGMDVTNKHDDRLKKVLQDCLADYVESGDNNMIASVFDKDQVVSGRLVNVMPLKGIYRTYSDVFNNKPIADDDFEIRSKKNRYYLINKKSNIEEGNFYGFSDGQDFYINVSKYANEKHYLKTEIIADKYYIEDVLYNPNNTIAMGAMFGLIGVAVASATSQASVPMMIDCYSGQPLFLSNAELKTMLSTHPSLLNEYKDGKKTNDEIKNILKKYYQQI
ncbi:DUF6563 family protein [Flavobacterium sp. W1B]|uniref:DUF6563 family protein n=1 Tax=Flavobacterium sp. W1B TaxID=3394146 RepID=UPI0039BD05EB